MAHERDRGRVGAAANLGPAGFWIRAAAYIIDSFIVGTLLIVTSVAAVELGGLRFGESYLLLQLIIGATYFSLFHSGGWQATPGKRAVGIYVIRRDGEALSIPHALGRHFATLLSALTFGIGYLMAGWNRDKKALHDYVAGTRAVRGRVD
jgi:uncharacterized RDD family membrane protein YckC